MVYVHGRLAGEACGRLSSGTVSFRGMLCNAGSVGVPPDSLQKSTLVTHHLTPFVGPV